MLKFNSTSSDDIYFFFVKGDCIGNKEIVEGLCRFAHYHYEDSIYLHNWEKLDLFEPYWVGTNNVTNVLNSPEKMKKMIDDIFENICHV